MSSPTPHRLDSLTGLRFPAALAVFAYHTSIHSYPSRLTDVASAVAGRGYVGVAFFFVLSGFVLTWSHRDGDRPAAFYRRRFARIAPVYWTCLAGALVLDLATSGHPVREVARALPSVLGLQAWHPSSTVHFAANGPGWSISAEMFFYLMFPLLIGFATTRSRRIALGVLVVVLLVGPALALRPTDAESAAAATWVVYVLPVTRLGEFVVGMLLAQAVAAGWRPPLRLPAALVLTGLVYWLTAYLPVWTSVSVALVVPFALVIAAAATADLEGRRTVWSSRLATTLGAWSFAFYLVQSLVLKVEHEGVKVLHLPPGVEWATNLLALAVAVAAAGVLHSRVEAPLERRLRHAPPRATPLPPLAA